MRGLVLAIIAMVAVMDVLLMVAVGRLEHEEHWFERGDK